MKYIKNKILILPLAIFFSACSQSALSVFDQDSGYAQHMQYTKVIKSLQEEEVHGVFNITYLNSAEPSKWDNGKENFLIGSYIFEQDPKSYTLTMNQKAPIEIVPLNQDDVLYKTIALKNHWAKYVFVSFDTIQEKTLTLRYTHTHYSPIQTQFIKE